MNSCNWLRSQTAEIDEEISTPGPPTSGNVLGTADEDLRYAAKEFKKSRARSSPHSLCHSGWWKASALADCSDHLLQLLRSWDELPAVSGGHPGCFAKKPLHYDTKKILLYGLRDKKCRCIEYYHTNSIFIYIYNIYTDNDRYPVGLVIGLALCCGQHTEGITSRGFECPCMNVKPSLFC